MNAGCHCPIGVIRCLHCAGPLFRECARWLAANGLSFGQANLRIRLPARAQEVLIKRGLTATEFQAVSLHELGA